MSKTMLLQQFLRSYPLRSCEVTRVAQSMDETELEVEIEQIGKVNGMDKYFDTKLHFTGVKIKTMPWAKMKIVRCRSMGESPGFFEMVDAGGGTAEVSFKECVVTFADDYDKVYNR